MKIFGIGTDIVNIKRIDKSLKINGSKFKNRIFSKKEITYCDNKKYQTYKRITPIFFPRIFKN